MKEKFINSILQKTIISILAVIMLTNLIFPVTVSAAEQNLGGALFKPMQNFLLSIGDTVMWIVNSCSGNAMLPYISVNIHGSYLGEFWNGVIEYLQSLAFGIGNLVEIESPSISIPVMFITPEKIFANKVALLDVNIINPNTYGGLEGKSIVSELQGTVSSWYKGLRNLAIVGLLSVLMYIAIRIIISSAQDKSKYKEMFMDWLIAFCLLFFMHYIMSFSITIVEVITDAIADTSENVVIDIDLKTILENDDTLSDEKKQILETMVNDDGKLVTDLTGKVRFMVQMGYIEDTEGEAIVANGWAQQMAYTIMYLVLVIYTIMFLVIYIKRLVYIIFLTLIAPLVALTYPIDKFGDGKSQAFSTWLKEYLFNLLIQPMHLLMYTVFIGTAITLAEQYLIYPLVVMGFMLQSEKILRKLFGFSKSDTASSLTNSAFGGALVMQGLNMIKSGGKKAVKGAANAAIGEKGLNFNTERTKDPEMNINSEIPTAFDKENESKTLNKPSQEEQKTIGNEWTSEDQKRFEELAEQREDPNNYMDPYMNRKIEEEYKDLEDKKIKAEEAEALRMAAEEEKELKQLEEENQKAMKQVAEGEKQKALEEQKGKPNYFKGATSLVGKYIRENPDKIAKGVLKTAGGIAGAATLGTVGIAAGLASDDFSNVFTYGATAGAVGAGLGGSLGKATIELPSAAYKKTTELKEKIEEEHYGKKEYEKIKNKRLDDEFMKNKEMQKLYKNKFDGTINGQEAWKVAMNAALEYRKYGITDNDTIIKAMKAKSKFIKDDDLTNKRRIVTAQLASQAKTEKEIETIQDRLIKNNTKKEQVQDEVNMLRQINNLAQFD